MLLTLIVCTILSLEADFKQVKETRLLQEPEVATGHLSYRSPDRLCWEYLTPTAYKWELGAASPSSASATTSTPPTTSSTKSTSSSTTSPQVQQLLQFIIRSISGDNLQDNANFTVTQQPASAPSNAFSQGNALTRSNTSTQNSTSTQGSTTYLLVPKKRDLRQLFQSIEITLNPTTQVAERVVLTEKNGDRSTITFHNIQIK